MARRLPRPSWHETSLSLLLLILVLAAPWQAAHAQDFDARAAHAQDIDAQAARAQDVEPRDGAIIESIDLSGLSRDSLSPVCGASSTSSRASHSIVSGSASSPPASKANIPMSSPQCATWRGRTARPA